VIADCARCRSDLALHTGRPRVAADGRVELFCALCWDLRDEPIVVAAPILEEVAPAAAPPRRSSRRIAMAAVAIVLGVAGTVVATRQTPPASAALPVVDNAVEETITEDVQAPAADDPPPPAPAIDDERAGVTTIGDGEPLDEQFPTLKAWIHPVTDSAELTPVRETRRFGAKRAGVDREECGEGHCGVDLAGPRGRPVVAVAWGTVVRVEHSERGRDGRSGRYVRIEHPDGVFTSYMHLDSIAPTLEVGDEVDAGQVIGTLGKSAIYNGEEHLHFALEITTHGEVTFIDPTPFLTGARVVPIPARVEGDLAPADRAQW